MTDAGVDDVQREVIVVAELERVTTDEDDDEGVVSTVDVPVNPGVPDIVVAVDVQRHGLDLAFVRGQLVSELAVAQRAGLVELVSEDGRATSNLTRVTVEVRRGLTGVRENLTEGTDAGKLRLKGREQTGLGRGRMEMLHWASLLWQAGVGGAGLGQATETRVSARV